MVIHVTVDDRNLKRRLARIDKKLDSGMKLSVSDTGRWARDAIKTFIPKQSRQSEQSIIYKVEVMTPDIKEAVIGISRNPRPHPEKTWNGEWFNLPRWMFDSPKAINRKWHSGNITSMRAVPGYATVVFGNAVRTELINAIK